MAGDQESKRPKFVVVQYNGPSLAGMAKSRAGSHKPEVDKIMGQHHVFFFADDPTDMTEDEVMTKIKKSSGANYDLGSNSKGYESKAGEIKNQSKTMYLAKEKETNITKPVVFFEGALSKTTPCDLSGRPTVAPPTGVLVRAKSFSCNTRVSEPKCFACVCTGSYMHLDRLKFRKWFIMRNKSSSKCTHM